MIEARSCERFSVLSKNLNDKELAKFFGDLLASEAGHYSLFLGFARKYMDKNIVDELWDEFLTYEADYIKLQGKITFGTWLKIYKKSNIKKITTTILYLLIITNLNALQAQDIIPKPKSYNQNGEVFQLTSDVNILYSGDLKEMAEFLAKSLSLPTGWDFTIKKSKSLKARFYFHFNRQFKKY